MRTNDRYGSYGTSTRAIEDWASRSLCGQLVKHDQADPEEWFPLSDGTERADVRRAKARCRACTVVAECALYALTTGQEHGIWGGLTPRERRAQSRQAVA